MDGIKQKLEELHDVLAEISLPVDVPGDPFSTNPQYLATIVDTLSTLVSKAGLDKERIEDENRKLYEILAQYCQELNRDVPTMGTVHNSLLQQEILKNEFEKISVIRETVRSQIKVLEEDINTLKHELGDEQINSSPDLTEIVSLERIDALKELKTVLLVKIDELETQRQYFYDEIISFNYKLSRTVEFSYSEKIGDLRRMLDQIKKEYKRRKEKYEGLLREIRRREAILIVQARSFEFGLEDDVLGEMDRYSDHLRAEQTRLFNDIFDRTVDQITEINQIVGRNIPKYERTEESLAEMRESLEGLHLMKDLYVEIVEKIEKRNELLERMTEFEKIASDPRRLFKSSFQLNSEEKFRNNAYPSLLKIEECLFELIGEFEKAYGVFVFEGKEFRVSLKSEIENRIINRTVFISRCDSPFRKKKWVVR